MKRISPISVVRISATRWRRTVILSPRSTGPESGYWNAKRRQASRCRPTHRFMPPSRSWHSSGRGRRRGSNHPFRLLEFADQPDITVPGRLADDGLHGRVRARFHGITLGFAVPVGDRDQRARIADLAMQRGAARPRRPLDQFTRTYPGVGILFRRAALADVHFKDEFHTTSLMRRCKAGRYAPSVMPRAITNSTNASHNPWLA